MVLTAYFGLSSVTGLSCHRRLQDHHLDRLDISVGISGPHDFAVRFRRRSSARRHRVHRIPLPTSVTTAIRPSYRGGTCESIKLFLPNRKAKFFSKEGWTRRANQCRRVLPPPLWGRVGVGGSPKRVCPCGPPPPTPPRKGEGTRAVGWARFPLCPPHIPCGCGHRRAPRLSSPSITRSMW
jgi:hypothetical protein